MSYQTPHLKKILGVFSLVMINIVAVDSLRTLPFSATYGFSLVFYYLLASLTFLIPVALVSAELATGWPDRGGIYVWVREAFGERWGFLVIWLQWVYNVVWYPTILSFIAGAIAFLVNPALANSNTYMFYVILLIFWGATFLNGMGMRVASFISTIGALMGTLIPMAFIILLGIIWYWQGHPLQITFSAKTFFPDMSNIQNLVFLTAVLFGLVGMEMSAVHADEVRNPSKTFPRAILISTIIIFFSLVCSSLAIALVVPHEQLSVVTGLLQAFQTFFAKYNMHWINPIITLLIVIGGIGGIAAWVIGPTKGLLIAVQDGIAPQVFGKTNRKGAPIVILFLQAVIVTALSSIFLFMPNVTSSYWILSAITAQLAMLVYIAMFAAAIYLRYKNPNVQRGYRIPGGNLGIWIVGLVGTLSATTAIFLGFIPPAQIAIGSLLNYELILILGILVLCAPPWIIYLLRKKNTPKSDKHSLLA